MEERKPFTLIMTDERIMAEIRSGYKTSSELAAALGVHKVSMRGKLLDLIDRGVVSRSKIGQTFVYTVKEE